MEISPLLLLRMTLASFVFGLMAGVLTDLHGFLRCFLGLESPTGKGKRCLSSVFRFFQDFLWFAVLGIGMCLILYDYNSGRFRMMVPFAVLLGVLLYRVLLHPMLSPLLSLAAALTRRMIALVLRPLFLLLGAVGTFFSFLFKKVKLVLEKKKILRYNKNRKQELLQEAERGFL